MKAFIEEYGRILVSALVILILVAATPFMGNQIADGSSKVVTAMTNNITEYGYCYISYDTPAEPMSDTEYLDFITEAEKHLGKEYVFGASGPDNFDCSGYVSWVINESGFGEIERTTASGLTAICSYVPNYEAQPGDLIFFENTYKPGISHVGIYIGEDDITGEKMMIHCGDPIQKTSIETAYWQEHFFCFGRLNEEIRK